MFGLLVKGLRIGLDLLRLLQKEHLTSSLAKVVSLPVLDGDDGLDKFLSQFEAAIKSDFPNFQVCDTRFFWLFSCQDCFGPLYSTSLIFKLMRVLVIFPSVFSSF